MTQQKRMTDQTVNIVIGAVVGVVLVFAVGYMVWRRRSTNPFHERKGDSITEKHKRLNPNNVKDILNNLETATIGELIQLSEYELDRDQLESIGEQMRARVKHDQTLWDQLSGPYRYLVARTAEYISLEDL
jgi:hypothetical protein